MDYEVAKAHVVVWLSDGKRLLEALAAEAPAGAQTPSPAGPSADQPQPARQPAERQLSQCEWRLAEIGRLMIMHIRMLMAWNFACGCTNA
jgi:hypothetical protein